MNKEEKYRRMALRRQEGSRALPNPRAKPAPAESYLVAHACFSCRKSFKVHPRDDDSAKCPQCGGVLHEMGRSFKAPKQKDQEQWLKVQALYEHGFRFYSYRSYPDAPRLPESLKEVEDFVAQNPNHPFRVLQPSNGA